jgi:hypothetical protein
MSSEYRPAEHVARELLGLLIEDGCDAVSITWSRTDGKRTVVRHEAIGNAFAVEGMLYEALENYGEETIEEEDEESNHD